MAILKVRLNKSYVYSHWSRPILIRILVPLSVIEYIYCWYNSRPLQMLKVNAVVYLVYYTTIKMLDFYMDIRKNWRYHAIYSVKETYNMIKDKDIIELVKNWVISVKNRKVVDGLKNDNLNNNKQTERKLKRCRKCRKLVSDNDIKCFHCGCKNPYKNSISSLSIILICFILFFLMFILIDLFFFQI